MPAIALRPNGAECRHAQRGGAFDQSPDLSSERLRRVHVRQQLFLHIHDEERGRTEMETGNGHARIVGNLTNRPDASGSGSGL